MEEHMNTSKAAKTRSDLHRPGRQRAATPGGAGHQGPRSAGLIAYVRVSTAREDMIAPELQIGAMEAWAAREGVPLVDIVPDLDRSGRDFAKRSIATIIERVRRGEAAGAVVYNYSRFGRNAALALAHIAELERAGGQIISVTEPVDPETAIGRFTRTTALAVAELQSDQISDSWKAVIAQRVKNGLPGDGQPRFGYVYHRTPSNTRACPQGCDDKDNPCKTGYVPDPHTAPLLREMYLSYLSGTSLPALAERLHSARVPTVRGGRWVTTTVRDMLDNGFGAGLIAHKGAFMDGRHQAVISPEEWAAYVRRRDASRGKAPRHRNAVHATAGLAVCGLCGANLVAASTKRDGPAYILRCGRMQSSGRGACPGVWIVRAAVEEAVIAWLAPLAAQMTESAVSAPARKSAPEAAVLNERGTLERRRSDLKRRIKRLTDAYEVAALDLDDYQTRSSSARAALADVEKQLHDLPDADHETTAFKVTDVLTQWDQFSTSALRDVLSVLIQRIVVYPRGADERIHIEGRFGTGGGAARR